MDGVMICPFCSHNNIQGADECESCFEDLSSVGGVIPKTKIEKVLMEDPVSKLAPRQPVFVKKEESLLEAVKKMNAGKVGYTLVVSGDKLEGILTERDLLFKVLGMGKDLSKIPVSDFMTAHVEALSETDTLASALNKMSIGGFRHIPIHRDGKPVGIISARDVLKYLSRLFP